jgi:hypothetical protein
VRVTFDLDVSSKVSTPVTHFENQHGKLKTCHTYGVVYGVHLVDLRDIFVCFRGVKGRFFFKTPFFWGISSGLSPSCILGEVTHMMFQGKTAGDVGLISGL